MGHRKTISSKNSFSGLPYPNIVNISGTMTPNCFCNYKAVGYHDGLPIFGRDENDFFVWYSGEADKCFISVRVGYEVEGNWQKNGKNFIGEYLPAAGFQGIAIVSQGPHF
jgi:hypothetical protein